VVMGEKFITPVTIVLLGTLLLLVGQHLWFTWHYCAGESANRNSTSHNHSAPHPHPPSCPPIPAQTVSVDANRGSQGYIDLCRIALNYGTDKSPLVDAQWVRHSYTPVYHSFFFAKRNLVKKVIELGVGGVSILGKVWQKAASGRMWRDYFCNARIYLMDVQVRQTRML